MFQGIETWRHIAAPSTPRVNDLSCDRFLWYLDFLVRAGPFKPGIRMSIEEEYRLGLSRVTHRSMLNQGTKETFQFRREAISGSVFRRGDHPTSLRAEDNRQGHRRPWLTCAAAYDRLKHSMNEPMYTPQFTLDDYE